MQIRVRNRWCSARATSLLYFRCIIPYDYLDTNLTEQKCL
jgi:hypothetical protein